MSNKEIQMISELRVAVQTIKTAILQSQARAVKGVNQEQLALYYGVGRYIPENTRNQKWGLKCRSITNHFVKFQKVTGDEFCLEKVT